MTSPYPDSLSNGALSFLQEMKRLNITPDQEMALFALQYIKNPEMDVFEKAQDTDIVAIMTQTNAMNAYMPSETFGNVAPIASTISKNLKGYQMIALSTQDPNILSLALTNIEDINEQAGPMGTLGHILTKKGSVAQLDVALQKGLDPTMLSETGERMVDIALWNDNAPMAHRLIQAERDWIAQTGKSSMDRTPTSPLDSTLDMMQRVGLTREEALASLLIEATQQGKIARMTMLMENGASPDSPIRMGLLDPSSNINDPLDVIYPTYVMAGQKDITEQAARLFYSKSNRLNEIDANGMSLASIAAMAGTGKTITLLNSLGVDFMKRDGTDKSPLSYARDENNSETITVLEDMQRAQRMKSLQEAARIHVTPQSPSKTSTKTQEER